MQRKHLKAWKADQIISDQPDQTIVYFQPVGHFHGLSQHHNHGLTNSVDLYLPHRHFFPVLPQSLFVRQQLKHFHQMPLQQVFSYLYILFGHKAIKY